MPKLNGREETIFSVLILGESFLLIGLSNAMMVAFFLSGINLSISLSLNPAIYRIGNASNIRCPRCKEQLESHLQFDLLLQCFQNYYRLIWANLIMLGNPCVGQTSNSTT